MDPYCGVRFSIPLSRPTVRSESPMTAAAIVSRWARRYVLVGAFALVCWQVGALADVPRETEALLGVFGVVLHTIFGKAYSLVPSYFERQLAVPRAPAVGFPLTVLGTAGLVVVSLGIAPSWTEAVGTFGAISWGLGVCVFLGAIGWTIRDNPTGRETATGETNADRWPVDRAANGFVPVALAYLTVGTYETVAIHSGFPIVFDGYVPRVSRLLAAGTAAMFVFALGFRLLPRFLVAPVPKPLVASVLPAGALGPALLAASLGEGVWFRLGAILEAIAVLGFALAYGTLFVRSTRRRVGFYSVLAGAVSGVLGVGLGLSFAFGHRTPSLVLAHVRLNVLGLLGLTIAGVAYQFYPPALGDFSYSSDRTAFVSIALLAGGLLAEVLGLVGGLAIVVRLGELGALTGAMLYGYLLCGVFHAR